VIFSLLRAHDAEKTKATRLAILRVLAETDEAPAAHEVTNMIHPAICEGGVSLTESEVITALVELAGDRLIDRSKGRVKIKRKTWRINEDGKAFLAVHSLL
jgi:hypothetical protein